MKTVVFNGTEKSILKILEILPQDNKAIRSRGKAITIPTHAGAVDVYMQDRVVVDGNTVTVEHSHYA